ncbi:hypothetical protein mRhiFer1_008897 [Rhinolophus ferrumequinum]|uniref:Uncharacterized protein n=1 Tax=Rhinolophus ferrumequinum TaxID=59479 RepID=A0A7J7TE70_RHIFE|nr:hypothetical protein mRhiFer1_008897 [Rhinolophus ferrumequinum]
MSTSCVSPGRQRDYGAGEPLVGTQVDVCFLCLDWPPSRICKHLGCEPLLFQHDTKKPWLCPGSRAVPRKTGSALRKTGCAQKDWQYPERLAVPRKTGSTLRTPAVPRKFDCAQKDWRYPEESWLCPERLAVPRILHPPPGS